MARRKRCLSILFVVAANIVLLDRFAERGASFIPVGLTSVRDSWRRASVGEDAGRDGSLDIGLLAVLSQVVPAPALAADGTASGSSMLADYAPFGIAMAVLALLIFRSDITIFEALRQVQRHPTLQDGTRMEAWNPPAFPFGNFAQHVTMCPYTSIKNVLDVSSKQNGHVIDYRLWMPGVMIADNDAAVKELLSGKVTIPALRSLGDNLPPYKRLFGRGLFMISSDDWLRQHRIASKGMSSSSMDYAATLVSEQVQAEFERLELAISGDGKTAAEVEQMRKELGISVDAEGEVQLEPGEFMKNIVSRVLTHVAFGQGMNDEDRNTILRCFNFFYNASLSPTIAVPGFIDSPFPGAREMREAIEDLHGIGYKFIAREREAEANGTPPAERPTLLASLLNAQDEDNSKLDEEEVVHNVFAFMVAGIATTSDSLASNSFLLARDQDVQEKLYEEVKNFRTWDEIKKLKYLSAVITEQLRVWPPLIGVPPRTMSEDTDLGGLHLPAGTDVSIHGLALHRRKHVWGEDAEDFRPERFLENGKDSDIKNPLLPSPLPKGIPEEAFVAFGGGVRTCIARPLAMVEMKFVIMELVQRYHVTEVDPEDFGMQIAFPVVFPKRHLRLRLVKRESVTAGESAMVGEPVAA